MQNISVLGLGVPLQLTAEYLELLTSADKVIGWARHQELLAGIVAADKFVCVQKLAELKAELADTSGNTVIVASGDPLFYGIGSYISKLVGDKANLTFHGNLSSIQAACHQQGLALQNVKAVSLHGRPLTSLRRHVRANTTLAILTDQDSNPQALARECIRAGFENAQITVHENLGYPHTKSSQFAASDLSASDAKFAELHVSIIQTKTASTSNHPQPEFAGIEDIHFVTGDVPGKGMISKREVRLQILSQLQLQAGDVLWDVGAGCGGVAVEAALWQSKAEVYAIEHHRQRLQYLNQNVENFGVVQNLTIINGTAPSALNELSQPNKVFIGGSDGAMAEIFEHAWLAIPVGGVIVASAVLAKTSELLSQLFAGKAQLKLASISRVNLGVSRGEFSHGQWQNQNKAPVDIYWLRKDREHT